MSFLCAISRQDGTHMHGGWPVYCDVVMTVYRHSFQKFKYYKHCIMLEAQKAKGLLSLLI